jgi:uncharacterized protein YjbK
MKKEIELKYRLGKKEDFYLFERFLEQYRCDKKQILRQENSYFDTPKLDLRRARISLRLRKQNQEYLLSAKQSLEKKGAHKHLSIRLEYEGPLDKRLASLIYNDHLSPLDAFAFLRSRSAHADNTKKLLCAHMKKTAKTGVQIIGSFKNLRTTVPIMIAGHKMIIELDHSFYPKGIEVHEVEVEFVNVRQVATLQPAIEKLFRTAGIRVYRSSSKSSRLYRILFG